MKRRVPLALIAQVCYPRPCPRLHKLVGLKEIKAAETITTARVIPARVITEKIDQGEFRYWQMNGGGDNYLRAICRWCGFEAYNNLSRKRHHDGANCAHKLDFTAAYLNRTTKCLVCDDTTGKQRWGFPLCSSPCEEVWKYTIPEAFVRATDAVRKFQVGSKIGHVTLHS